MREKKSISTGRFKIKRRSRRIQGQTAKLKRAKISRFFGGVGFLVKMIVAIVIIAGAVMMGVNIQNSTTTRRFGVRAMSTDSPKPYKAMAVIEPTSGRLLSGYHSGDRLPMASTTKIATAIVAIEELGDLTQEFVVPDAAVGIEGTSMYLRKGEKLTVEELLYGLMLPSGNDAAVALANIVSGSETAFMEKLNGLAQKLGLINTNFVTASGLHHQDHYTSAEDLAKLTAYAMKNEAFKKIVSTPSITVRGSEPDKPRFLKNKQKLMFSDTLKAAGITVTGVKSGFTPEAGRCLVTSATNSLGMEIIVVVLNSPKMFEESEKAILETFGDYKMVELLSPKKHISKIAVQGSNTKDVNIYSLSGFSYPLTAEEQARVKIKYTYPETILAPVAKDQEVGQVELTLNGVTIFSSPICTIESAEESKTNKLKKIIEDFLK